MDSILKSFNLDRINRIYRINVDCFPEENGQTLSPSAKVFITSNYDSLFTRTGKYLTGNVGDFIPPQADGVFLVYSGN